MKSEQSAQVSFTKKLFVYARRRRAASLFVLCVFVGIGATGAYAAGVFSSSTGVYELPNNPPPTLPTSATPPAGLSLPVATGASNIVLKALLTRAKGMGLTPTSASLDAPTADDLAFGGVHADGLWLNMPIHIGSFPDAQAEVWRADLFASDLRDIMAWSHTKPLYGATITATEDDGTVITVLDHALPALDVMPIDSVFAVKNATSGETDIRKRAADAGLNIVSLKMLDLLQPAPEVVISVPWSDDWLNSNPDIHDMLFGHGDMNYEGYRVAIQDERTGKVVFSIAVNDRTGTTRTWMVVPSAAGISTDTTAN